MYIESYQIFIFQKSKVIVDVIRADKKTGVCQLNKCSLRSDVIKEM
ncbi:hypothetical protein [Chitinophaga silvisoli]|nr:hypothetical protein [Chitinophaga silvisoli]